MPTILDLWTRLVRSRMSIRSRRNAYSILDDIETSNGHRSDLATLQFSKKIDAPSGSQLAQSAAVSPVARSLTGVKSTQHTVVVAQLLVSRKHFWLVANTSENHTTTAGTVRFQKKMRPVSLEIPEPDATASQNLMRQNTKLTRSDATRSTLRPKCPQSAERPLAGATRKTGEEIGAGKRVR